MRNRHSFIKSEHGQILIWVIGIMLLAALVIPPLLASSYSGLRASTIRKEKTQELYAADTGVEDALNWISSQGNVARWDESGIVPFPGIGQQVDYPLGIDANLNGILDESEWSEVNESYAEVTVKRTGNWTYKVNSTGSHKYAGTHVKLQVEVTLGTQTFVLEIPQPPKPQEPEEPDCKQGSYAIFSSGEGQSFVSAPGGQVLEGDVYINGNFITTPSQLGGGSTIVEGSLYCNGDVMLEQQSQVTGNVSATGNINLDSSSIIEGNAWANQSISHNSKNYIGGDAYAQIDVNVNDGWVVGSAWADHNVNVPAIIHQSAFANNDINVPGGVIEGWAYYWNNLNITGGGTVGNSAPLTEEVSVPLALMPGTQPIEDPGAPYLGNATDVTKGGGEYTPPNGTLAIKGTTSVSTLGLVQVGSGGPVYIKGNLDFANNAVFWLEGTVYVDGKIDMVNNCQVLAKPGTATPAVLVANGDITIKNKMIAVPDENMPLIMSVNGNILLWNNGIIYAALWAPNGTVMIRNGTFVYGAVWAEQIITENGYKIVYNQRVSTLPGVPSGCVPGEPETPPDEPVPPEYVLVVYPTGKVTINSYIVLEE